LLYHTLLINTVSAHDINSLLRHMSVTEQC